MDPGSASLDQVLGMLRVTAMSPAMAAEIAAYKAIMTTPVPFTLHAADGSTPTATLDDSDAAKWMPDGFTHAETVLGLAVLPPYPVIVFSSEPGGFQMAPDRTEMAGDGYTAHRLRINASVFASSDQIATAQRKARLLAYCFGLLVRRTEAQRGFGPLVESMVADTTIEEAGARPVDQHDLVAAARVRMSAFVLF